MLGVPAENLYAAEEFDFRLEDAGAKRKPENSFEAVPRPQTALKKTIKVIAVGGGGGNALNHIISHGIEGVDMLAVNTDVRSLEMSLAESKIILGERVTKGLGAGALPDVGESAAKESLNDIRAYLKGADMVYLTAGMGGGTGTGAVPVIAKAAKEMGILTVAVVTKPFSFEGKRRRRYAEEGIARLFPETDALIVVPNDRLLELADKATTLTESFSMADEVLRQAVQGVTDLVTRPGTVNVDFADLRSVMKDAGRSVMGIGVANGDESVGDAVRRALESPLMECSMNGAKGVLMNVTYKNDLPLFELGEAAAVVEDVISENANFIWGCVLDPTIENDVEVTLVAAGFDEIEDARSQPYARQARERRRERREEPVEHIAPSSAGDPHAAPSVETGEETPAPYENERYGERTRDVFPQCEETPASEETSCGQTRRDDAQTPKNTESASGETDARVPAWLLEAASQTHDEDAEKARSLRARPAERGPYEEPTFLRRGNKLKTEPQADADETRDKEPGTE